MKGVSFQAPFEFSLRTEGESWHQGDALSGTFEVKTHGEEALTVSELRLHLAYGQLKKVRLKFPDAFKILSSSTLQSLGGSPPFKEASFPWSFQTDRNCPVTDNSGSLYLLYGKGDSLEKLGQLQLPILPFQTILEIIKIFEISYRFTFKTQKWSKGKVEIKLAPPASKAFALLEQLHLFFHFDAEDLVIDYVFHVKSIEATAADMKVAKVKKETQQIFSPGQYSLPSGRLNHDWVEAAIKEVLDLVQRKVVF